jgi:hypothetical protein
MRHEPEVHGGAAWAAAGVEVERGWGRDAAGEGLSTLFGRETDGCQVAVAEENVAAQEAVQLWGLAALLQPSQQLRIDALAPKLVDELVVVDLPTHRPRVHHHLLLRRRRRPALGRRFRGGLCRGSLRRGAVLGSLRHGSGGCGIADTGGLQRRGVDRRRRDGCGVPGGRARGGVGARYSKLD